MLCTPKAAVSRRLGFPIVIAISAQPLTLTRIRWPEATLGAHFATFARESHLAGFCALYMSKSLYIIDAFSQIFRAYWSPAARRRSVRGKPVGAAFIFARMCLALIQKQKPDFLVAAFDSKEKTFRDDIYKEYKAGREAMPEDLAEQLPLVRSILEAMGIPVLEVPGLEADDIIGVLSRLGEKRGYEVRLISRDKDLKQLLTEHVKLLNEDENSTYGPAELQAEFGLRPEQFLEVLALAGDSVDNIPGAKGVGVKTAAKLLAEHGSLEKIFTAAESGAIKQPKLRENLIAFKPESKLSRQLAAIVTDGEWAAKVPFDESAAKVHDLEERKAKLLPLLVDLNFNSIVEDLGWKAEAIASSPESGVRSPESKSTNAAPKAETGAPRGVQKSMFGSAHPPNPARRRRPRKLVDAHKRSTPPSTRPTTSKS
jgi:5'-3' exonuclease